MGAPTPIPDLPPELLYQIFCTAVLDSDSLDITWNPHRLKAHRTKSSVSPWTIAGVSSTWRAAALSCPHIWARVVLVIGPADAHCEARVDEQLRRAGLQELEVFCWGDNLDAAGAYAPEPPELVLPASLLAASGRWRALHLRLVDFRHAAWTVRQTISVDNGLGALERLSIVGDPDDDLGDVFGLGEVVPRLREVELVGVAGRGSPSALLPWSQLTHFRGVYPLPKLLDILRLTSNLRSSEMGIRPSFATSYQFCDPVGPLIVLPHLRRLIFHDEEDHATIVKYLDAPNLQDLLCLGS
ncbi:unnamed protein product [Mycena citricolor]|uniref:F-box domain-containing protein n=1 Tax=Mycena citricolor TaxID=2018698 RepID=A0AAD2HNA3_9AGAR|nr:unnamed protein product [Mycena citricolor]